MSMIRYAKVLNKITDTLISLTCFVALLFHDYLTVYAFFMLLPFLCVTSLLNIYAYWKDKSYGITKLLTGLFWIAVIIVAVITNIYN